MNQHTFSKNEYFDLKNIPFADIFDSTTFVWEVLSKLKDYVAKATASSSSGVIIGENTIVEQGAYIKGPAIIGKNCFITHGAYIRDNVIIGENVHIGHGSEVKNSIILPHTAIAHLNYVGDSIIGGNVNFAAGAITANFRLDGKTVRVKNGEQTIDTGLLKFGAIIGDGSKVGVHAVLNPGAVLGKNCFVYPLTSVSATHKDNEVIK